MCVTGSQCAMLCATSAMLSNCGAVFEAEAIGGIVHLAAILPTVAQREPLRATRGQCRWQPQPAGNGAAVWRAARCVRKFAERLWNLSGGAGGVGDRSGSAGGSVWRGEALCRTARRSISRIVTVWNSSALRIGRVVGPGAQSATSAWRSQIFELLGCEGAGRDCDCLMLDRKESCWFTWRTWRKCWLQLLRAPQSGACGLQRGLRVGGGGRFEARSGDVEFENHGRLGAGVRWEIRGCWTRVGSRQEFGLRGRCRSVEQFEERSR